MSDPLISVIIPVYNVEKYLRECLDSVLNQTLRNIEVICVDDGSTDCSLEILNSYAKCDNRVKVLKQLNSGAGIARNKGIDIARGNYIAFLDADDFFKPNMLEKAYNNAITHNTDIVMFRHERYDEGNGKFYELPHMMNHTKFPNKDYFTINEISGNFYFDIYGWTWDKLFKRELIDKYNLCFQGTKIFNDMFFTYSALVVSSRISFINEILMTQRVNRSGSITKSVQNNWHCIIEALDYIKNFLVFNNFYDKWHVNFSIYALHMLIFTERQLANNEKEYMRMVIKNSTLKLLNIKLDNDEINYDINELKYINSIVKNCERYDTNLINIQEYKQHNCISYIYSKIIKGVKCYRQHGALYTVNRIVEKLINMKI